MKSIMKALLLILLVSLMPLAGCINDEADDDVSATDANQDETEILFEGDEPGEWLIGAVNTTVLA